MTIKARVNIKKAQDNQKRQYDAKHNTNTHLKLETKFLLRKNEMMGGKGASWMYDFQVGHMRSLKIWVKAGFVYRVLMV